jgi:hypothetical protein
VILLFKFAACLIQTFNLFSMSWSLWHLIKMVVLAINFCLVAEKPVEWKRTRYVEWYAFGLLKMEGSP